MISTAALRSMIDSLISPPAGELRAEDPKEGLRRLSLAAAACSFSFFWRMYSVGSNLGRPGADRGLPLLRGRSSLLDGQPWELDGDAPLLLSPWLLLADSLPPPTDER